VVSAAVDILNLIVEFNSSILLEHILQTKDSPNEVRGGQLLQVLLKGSRVGRILCHVAKGSSLAVGLQWPEFYSKRGCLFI